MCREREKKEQAAACAHRLDREAGTLKAHGEGREAGGGFREREKWQQQHGSTLSLKQRETADCTIRTHHQKARARPATTHRLPLATRARSGEEGRHGRAGTALSFDGESVSVCARGRKAASRQAGAQYVLNVDRVLQLDRDRASRSHRTLGGLRRSSGSSSSGGVPSDGNHTHPTRGANALFPATTTTTTAGFLTTTPSCSRIPSLALALQAMVTSLAASRAAVLSSLRASTTAPNTAATARASARSLATFAAPRSSPASSLASRLAARNSASSSTTASVRAFSVSARAMGGGASLGEDNVRPPADKYVL